MAEVSQQLAEAEARREILITAPAPGIVTAIQAERGGRVSVNVPLLSVVPRHAVLEAQMFSSGRAIGFVRSGQRVLMRYHAYPYQKFGQYEGRVATISRTAVNPAELPPMFAGLTALYGGTEPVYRVTVTLATQTVLAYGNPTPLQAGMQVDADIVIERRRLIEWMFEPLFTVTGKWR
jgi:membrane fusion protein